MDITSLFKASVKTVRLKLPAGKLTQPNKSRILTKRQPHSDGWGKAQQVKKEMSQLAKFLEDNRAGYMQLAHHLKNSAQMTNEDRDMIDRESESILRVCSGMISELKQGCQRLDDSKQFNVFFKLITDGLQEYIASVRQIVSEQKKFRIQRELETYKFLKLVPDTTVAAARAESLSKQQAEAQAKESKEEEEPTTPAAKPSAALDVTWPMEDDLDDAGTDDDDSGELSPEDIQIFESENVQLYNELKGLSEEVEQIQKNVADIAQLQDVFTEKISLQTADIERIASTVVGATENVKDANEQIKQAIQRNAGLRVWVLFFLIVMSSTLLFLDWYND